MLQTRHCLPDNALLGVLGGEHQAHPPTSVTARNHVTPHSVQVGTHTDMVEYTAVDPAVEHRKGEARVDMSVDESMPHLERLAKPSLDQAASWSPGSITVAEHEHHKANVKALLAALEWLEQTQESYCLACGARTAPSEAACEDCGNEDLMLMRVDQGGYGVFTFSAHLHSNRLIGNAWRNVYMHMAESAVKTAIELGLSDDHPR